MKDAKSIDTTRLNFEHFRRTTPQIAQELWTPLYELKSNWNLYILQKRTTLLKTEPLRIDWVTEYIHWVKKVWDSYEQITFYKKTNWKWYKVESNTEIELTASEMRSISQIDERIVKTKEFEDRFKLPNTSTSKWFEFDYINRLDKGRFEESLMKQLENVPWNWKKIMEYITDNWKKLKFELWNVGGGHNISIRLEWKPHWIQIQSGEHFKWLWFYKNEQWQTYYRRTWIQFTIHTRFRKVFR